MFKMRKKLLLIVSIIAFSLISIFPTQAAAENLGDFKDENESHYYLDTVPDSPDDDYFEEGEQRRGFFWFLDAAEVAGEKFANIINNFANMAFTFNIFLTQLMIAALKLAYNFDFINIIIDEISDVMSGITGISASGNFLGSGIFGQLAIFVAMFAVIYAVFMLLFRKSMFRSLGAILQTAICLTIAILLFTNYAPFLKGINQITTEMSALVLGSEVDGEEESNSPTGLDENDLKNKMYDNLWTMFVDRPYLYMMYGKTRLDDDLTESRVKALLKAEVGSPQRLQTLEQEYNRPNHYITHSKVWERLSFTPVYLVINGITSFLVYALAFLLILFQFWFVMIAVFAPFALLIGAIPGMFNVIKRYFIELGLPLVLKIVVSFGALIVFSISEILYALDFQLGEMGGTINSTFGFYMAVVIVHWVLFSLLFFFRKRIANIFVNSNRFMREMKDGLDTSTAPIKDAIQGGTTAVGTAAGAMVGGVPGAMAGASIGKVTGQTVTGDASVGDLAQTAGKAYMYSTFSGQSSKANGGTLSGESKNNISEFLDQKEFGDDQERVINSLDKAGIEKVSKEDLNIAHNNIMKRIEEGKGLESNYSDMLVSNIQQHHQSRSLKAQEEKLQSQQNREKIPSTAGWMNESMDATQHQASFSAQPMKQVQDLPETSTWTTDKDDVYEEFKNHSINANPIAPDGNSIDKNIDFTQIKSTEKPLDTMNIPHTVTPDNSIPHGEISHQEIAITKMNNGEIKNETISGQKIEGSDLKNGIIKGQDIDVFSKIERAEKGEKASEIRRLEEREKLASLNLDKQRPKGEFEYGDISSKNSKTLEENKPKE